MLVRDAHNNIVEVRTIGSGTDENPYIMTHDVFIQDQSSNVLILPLVAQHAKSYLTANAVADTYQVSVESVADVSLGDHIRIINTEGDRYYHGTVLNITSLIITLDSPIDFNYQIGSEVTFNNTNMAVDGSVTPVHYHLRTGSPSIPSSIDITRMLMVCECVNPVDLNKFGDLNALTRGILFRQLQGNVMRNIWNIKANRELIALAYDWSTFDASHPQQGINGFSWRLTFNGQNKMGVALRVEQDGQLGIVVQDNLSSLVSLTCIVEGHVVEDY